MVFVVAGGRTGQGAGVGLGFSAGGAFQIPAATMVAVDATDTATGGAGTWGV